MKAIYVNVTAGRLTPLPEGRLALGQSGRGRELVIVPIAEGVQPGAPETWCRSGWEALASASVEVTEAGPRIVPERQESDWRLLILKGDPGYSRGAFYSYALPEGSRVLARGHGAYGIAGRCGGWEEILAVVPPTGRVWLPRKFGGEWLIWGPDGVRIVSDAEAAAEAVAAAAVTEVL